MTEEDVRGLVLWWATHRDSHEPLLANDFVYTSPIEVLEKRDFVEGMRICAPLRDVRLLAILVGPTNAAAFFECLDPVTALRHRTAWLLTHPDGLATSVTALSDILPSSRQAAP